MASLEPTTAGFHRSVDLTTDIDPSPPTNTSLIDPATPGAHPKILDGIASPPPLNHPQNGSTSISDSTKEALVPTQSDANNYPDEKLRLQAVQYYERLPEDIVTHFTKSSMSDKDIDTINEAIQVIKRSQDCQAEVLKRMEPKARNVVETLSFFDNHILEYSIMLGSGLIADPRYSVESSMELPEPEKCDRFVMVDNEGDRFPIIAIDGRLCTGKPKCSITNIHSFLRIVKCFKVIPPEEPDTETKEAPPEESADTVVNLEPTSDNDLSTLGLQLPNHKPRWLPAPSSSNFQTLSQMWNQMTSRDLTFGILTDYNESLLLLRHRQSGTLYVSRTIHFLDQTPSLIACIACLVRTAFMDAVSRRKVESGKIRTDDPDQKRQETDIEQGLAATGPPSELVYISHSLDPRPFPAGLFREMIEDKDTEEMTVIERFREMGTANTAYFVFQTKGILWSSHYTILTRHFTSFDVGKAVGINPILPQDASTSEALESSSSEPSSSESEDKPCLPLVVLEYGASPTKRGPRDMEMPWGGHYDDGNHIVSAVVKLKNHWELKNEAMVYAQLQHLAGIPTCISLYQIRSFGSFGALILSHNGGRVEKINVDERDILIKILQSIHDRGVLHQNLSETHILRNNQHMLSIVDFSRADIYAIDDKFRSRASEEMAEFEAILDELMV